eukprot:TRINITY_DN6408_c0_g1_i1.p1 TRINITY_DN6408_c0_g1~~TRINITY_DN6408_c0_g1_i1.p1  ORF type:complete len:864 (-),score=135.30 TRINITY_DN6408_c0_g1_i1:30-2621(-)
MRFSVVALAKSLHSKGQKSKFKSKFNKSSKFGGASAGTAGKFKSIGAPRKVAPVRSRLGSAVEILQGLAKESQQDTALSSHDSHTQKTQPQPAAAAAVPPKGAKNVEFINHLVDDKLTQKLSTILSEKETTPRSAGDFIRMMEAGKLAEKLAPTPSASTPQPASTHKAASTVEKPSFSAKTSLSELLKMQRAPIPEGQPRADQDTFLRLNEVFKGVEKKPEKPAGSTASFRSPQTQVPLRSGVDLPPLPTEAPQTPSTHENKTQTSSVGADKYAFLKNLPSASASGSAHKARQATSPMSRDANAPRNAGHLNRKPQYPSPSVQKHGAPAGFKSVQNRPHHQPSKPEAKKSAGELASDSMRWILDSLPHPTSHKLTIPLTLAELQPISSAVQKRWELYGKVRELHSSGRFTELIDLMEQEVAEAAGDLRAVIADTEILDLILDAYFALDRYGDVSRLFNSIRGSGHHENQHNPAHPRIAISVTGYCIAIESVLKFMPKDAGISVAIAMYQECQKLYEPTPQLVMAFFRGCNVLDPDSTPIQKFALEEFRRIAPAHQFSTSDVKSVVEAALNGACAKLGRTDLNTEDVFHAISPIMGATHSDAYRKTLVAVLPAIIRKLHVSSIDLLEKMRKSFHLFHPSSDLIDACVEAELNRPGHDPLHLYIALQQNLKHPRSSQASSYLRWVRNDCAQRLAVSLAETGSFKQARAILVHLLDSHQHVTLKTYYAVLSTFLQSEDFSEAAHVSSSLRSSYANPDPSTWNLLVRVNLGRSGSHVEIAESEVDRRIQAALVVFGQMVEALRTLEPTDETFVFAQKTIEKTLQELVEWSSERKSVAGLRKIIGAAQSLNLVESEAIASAKQLANTL